MNRERTGTAVDATIVVVAFLVLVLYEFLGTGGNGRILPTQEDVCSGRATPLGAAPSPSFACT